MTEELKTLKDIEFETMVIDNREDEENTDMDSMSIAEVEELRQEALKHIIELEGYKKMFKRGMSLEMTRSIEKAHIKEQAQADWIRHFFGYEECACGHNHIFPDGKITISHFDCFRRSRRSFI